MQRTADGEILIPLTEPETEWIGGRAVQKVMPTRSHAILQFAFATALEAWAAAGERGQVGTEWRFRASPPGEDVRPLVPDVAFMSFRRLRPLSVRDRETPFVAPEIVVEVRSPDDRQAEFDEKRRVYFAWGVVLELIADPEARTLEVYDADGRYERVDASCELYLPPAFPDLRLPLREMYAKLDIPPPRDDI